ncbi:MAG: permease-like cell division protein FtsX, partial [Armatimonadota bacterium]|nr:permease-like cell division protein FtsX [Armatimonadota bacterium]
MRLCTLNFILKEAATNVRRNGLMSLACVTTIMLSLALSGFVVLAFRNAENILHRVAEELMVAVYLKMDTLPQQRDRVGDQIRMLPHVQGAPILISKEQAWQTFSETIPDSLKGEIDGNPLPDTYMVKVDAPFRVPSIAQQLALIPQVDKVNAPYLEAHRAAAILRFVRLATNFVSILMVLITTFLVMNTIRLTLYARRHEIRVMQLVGATNAYIRTPFILEGLALGILGGALACACLAAGYPYLLHLVHQALAFDLPLITSSRELFRFYAEMLGVGAAVGTFGSLVSVRRFLRPLEYGVTTKQNGNKTAYILQSDHEGLRQEEDAVGSSGENGDLASVITRNYPARPDEHFSGSSEHATIASAETS